MPPALICRRLSPRTWHIVFLYNGFSVPRRNSEQERKRNLSCFFHCSSFIWIKKLWHFSVKIWNKLDWASLREAIVSAVDCFPTQFNGSAHIFEKQKPSGAKRIKIKNPNPAKVPDLLATGFYPNFTPCRKRVLRASLFYETPTSKPPRITLPQQLAFYEQLHTILQSKPSITFQWNQTREGPRESWYLFTYFTSIFNEFQVRAALLKSLSVYMSIRGHHDWTFRRPSMFSAAYNTGADNYTEAAPCNEVLERYCHRQTSVAAAVPVSKISAPMYHQTNETIPLGWYIIKRLKSFFTAHILSSTSASSPTSMLLATATFQSRFILSFFFLLLEPI